MNIKSAQLHLVSATEQALAAPDVFKLQEQNVHLIANEVMDAAGHMLELRAGRYRQDLDRMSTACTMLGVRLRAAERLRQEVEAALEARRDGVS